MKWSSPLAHRCNALRCSPFKNFSPTSPTLPKLPESKARNMFEAFFLLLAMASSCESMPGKMNSNRPTKFHGGFVRNDVYWRNLASRSRFAVANPSSIAAISPNCWASLKMRRCFWVGRSRSIDNFLRAFKKKSGPMHANSISLRPDHLQCSDPVCLRSKILSFDGNMFNMGYARSKCDRTWKNRKTKTLINYKYDFKFKFKSAGKHTM